ncbi:MAG: hypothetical protein EOS65_02735 [Mesorhizobium sp.]|uniref:hypothetical protein n=1 Tax=Mesorhizobium sp. TaxID=1871066 RepID=UPI000FE8D61D|nr:hypothetical protein [Mesorhizobium sp.]RWF44311.1 MAG: hypothetical protein EOS65_02735 [Mesorhizobium sp.]
MTDLLRECLQWSTAYKLRNDPLTLVLSIYVLGFLPAVITSLILSFLTGDTSPAGIAFRAIIDATLWPLKVAGF